MARIRRLDHVGIAVRDTTTALAYFRDALGLPVVHAEDNEGAGVRMTYLDAGNAYVQLLEPRRDDAPIAAYLEEHGEGIHHVCVAVDDVMEAIRELGQQSGDASQSSALGSGRGRPAAFIPGQAKHGVLIECTAFDRVEDVERRVGWLQD
jgi:methylmalonyl-CoA/ethylmalonyl-CoA epimerase